ncbi:FAD-dependent 5-carboxymethylaminomethyl-2-thiouridine(34) oxidoreductase MnmC [Legionella dresdenensis]|uniref:FAD-dependent 5-carboxymethylaminomethyl-2-thiouridine(34) oxidoreductase MnmC n=1 Tax=Legionella dresdenensis TaxID=450200 RepID=A0ABV8CB52_9GAMM
MSNLFPPIYPDPIPQSTAPVNCQTMTSEWQQLGKNARYIIGETGFNPVNFLNCWQEWLQYAPPDAELYYYAATDSPLSSNALADTCNQYPALSNLAEKLLDNYPILTPGFHYLTFENQRVKLILMLGDRIKCYEELLCCGDESLEPQIRTSFFNAWIISSPVANTFLKPLALLSTRHTLLVSNYITPDLISLLDNAGFEIVSSTESHYEARLKLAREPIRRGRTTPWHIMLSNNSHPRKVIIIGAGLAGCFTARALVKRGYRVLMLERGENIASGASGNTQAVLYPKLSAYESPLTAFMLNAYLFAHKTCQEILQQTQIGELNGIIQLVYSKREQISQAGLAGWLTAYPELGRLIDAQEASYLSGLELETGGLYLPLSGWLDCQSLCHWLTDHPLIEVKTGQHIEAIEQRGNDWLAGEYQAEIMIIANGYQSAQFQQTCHLPLKAIPGQISQITPSIFSRQLKIPLCGAGHVLPLKNNLHALGASYHQSLETFNDPASDDRFNLEKLAALSAKFKGKHQVKQHWRGIRAATPDYLPLVGPVPDHKRFLERFSGLATNSKRWLPYTGQYYQGLYLCTGFGSRGLTTAPLSAELLASMINNEPGFVKRGLLQALSPARFIIKSIPT